MIASSNLKEEEIYGKVNQKKLQVKVNQTFLDAAIEGAKAIIDGDLTPFNAFVPTSE